LFHLRNILALIESRWLAVIWFVQTAVKRSILLVDDSKFIRRANELALIKAGYAVCSAGDGEEGLRVAREKLPDLIVLDMMLPKLSGPKCWMR